MERVIPNRLRRNMQRCGLHPRGKARATFSAGWPAQDPNAMIEVRGDRMAFWPQGRTAFGGEREAEVRIPNIENAFRDALRELVSRAEAFRAAVAAWDLAGCKGYRPRAPYADEAIDVLSRGDLIDAARDGDLATIKAADPQRIDIHRTDDGFGLNALSWALYHSHIDCAIALLERFRINLNRTPLAQHGGWVATPLHLACQPHRFSIENRLGAIDETRDWSEEFVIAYVEDRHLPLIEWLITAGADIHHRCSVGQTPYSRAVSSGYGRIADLLERHGCGPEDEHQSGGYGQFMHAVRDMAGIAHLQELMRRGFPLPTIAEFEFYADAVSGYDEEKTYCDAVRAAFVFAA